MAHLVLPNGKGHGWRRDTPSHNDWEMADALFKGIKPRLAITGKVGFLDRAKHPTVRDQGAYGSCTGHGTRTALQTRMILRGMVQAELSPRGIYWRGREAEACISEDSGCEIRDVIDAVVKYGAPREEECPYPQDDKSWNVMARRPTKVAFERAKWHQIDAKRYKVRTVDEWLQALANKMPIVFGFSCFEDSFPEGRQGRIPFPAPGLDPNGGHCVCALSADADARETCAQNSWGDYGDNGYIYHGFEWIERKLSTDAWAVDHE